VSRPAGTGWRDRHEADGIEALQDAPRSGRPAEIDEIEVIAAALAGGG
jgi:transposase